MTDPYASDPYLPAMREDPPPPVRARVSDKSRMVAVALGFVTGVFGGHRYYAGKIGTGLLMTCTFGGLGMWWLFDMIILLSGEFKDSEGLKIRDWTPSEFAQVNNLSQEQIVQLQHDVDRLQNELMDVHERIDFYERMLQKGRQ